MKNDLLVHVSDSNSKTIRGNNYGREVHVGQSVDLDLDLHNYALLIWPLSMIRSRIESSLTRIRSSSQLLLLFNQSVNV